MTNFSKKLQKLKIINHQIINQLKNFPKKYKFLKSKCCYEKRDNHELFQKNQNV